jgi:dienelactone hydrolase
VIAWLYLPRNASPPYQTVLYFPDSTAELFRSSENAPTRSFDFIVRSGRALLLPVYKGTYERRSDSARPGASARRDLLIQWAKDLGRSIDYLETRKDIDASRLAFYGFSLGAAYAPVLTAVEKRFRASIVLGGGFTGRPLPPEAEAINFAPRVRVPTLMVSGREDFIRPVEISQRPLFNMLGTAEKKLAVIEGGHVPPKIQPLIKEILDWLDRYLGPVTTKG